MKLTIDRLGHHGDGIAEGPVFVPRALPGEVVEGDVESGRMAAPKIVTPSPVRIASPCPHYKTCGGCDLLHASDDFVADWKIGVVRTALAAHGLPAPIVGISTSPPRSRRRATLAGRRMKSGAMVGFHGRASGTLVAVPGCLLLRPEIMAAMPALEDMTALAASRKTEVTLSVTVSLTGLDLAVANALPLDRDRLQAAVEIARNHDMARLFWNGEQVAERRAPVQRIGRAEVSPPSGAFLQATVEGEAALIAAVTEAVGPARRIADLFSGCGTFALPLAEHAEVHAVEGDGAMLAALDRGWRHAEGLRRISTEKRDLFRQPMLAEDLARFDAVVIDPPRAGAEAQTRQLARSGVRRIAAVSCNPATFARDAKTLNEGGYRLEWVRVVDQFRWSPHVELAASFVRDHMAGE